MDNTRIEISKAMVTGGGTFFDNQTMDQVISEFVAENNWTR